MALLQAMLFHYAKKLFIEEQENKLVVKPFKDNIILVDVDIGKTAKLPKLSRTNTRNTKDSFANKTKKMIQKIIKNPDKKKEEPRENKELAKTQVFTLEKEPENINEDTLKIDYYTLESIIQVLHNKLFDYEEYQGFEILKNSVPGLVNNTNIEKKDSYYINL